jgi:hypothetical protein
MTWGTRGTRPRYATVQARSCRGTVPSSTGPRAPDRVRPASVRRPVAQRPPNVQIRRRVLSELLSAVVRTPSARGLGLEVSCPYPPVGRCWCNSSDPLQTLLLRVRLSGSDAISRRHRSRNRARAGLFTAARAGTRL